ncbi:ArsR family transcriptional regulator [Kibdelosporangium aridum]|uniref:ArsR family transcriptional regulator n=1 Tax=Kibdelosporangium aridum TaxID=2030 RepID=A0A428Z0W6_KIBAR|nr:helix-turn-helix domain-containing protein [Kibdelosporangium aridum]RSM78006.1 ArsR family transcriptional regulator [Kibdelosporangium aridum]
MKSEEQGRAKRLDANALRGLAHPLRVRILEILRSDGPSTATRLAKLLGEDSGNVSWHLRQLGEHGFAAEDVDRGTRRERWWVALHDYTAVDTDAFLDDTDLQGLLAILKNEVLQQQFRRAAGFLAQDWPSEWNEAAGMGYWKLRLNPTELTALRDELLGLLDRYDALCQDTARQDTSSEVVFQFQAFPRKNER